jgi:SAM-dependent methyltransferase
MSSYDEIPDFGLLYDSVPAYNERADVGFYVEEAKRAGGRVLELGCGTGRILLPIARAGIDIEIVGLDSSGHMLERCREKLRAEDEAVQSRARLREADVRDFNLGEAFTLVIAPFRIMQHLTTIEDQLRCLAGVARHLQSHGRFVFDVFNPNFTRMVTHDDSETGDTPEFTLPDGRTMRRNFRIRRVRWLDQVNEIELIYYLTDPDGREQRFVHAFDMRWYLAAELSHLLARAGFREVAHYGDFARGPLTSRSPEHIVVAELGS